MSADTCMVHSCTHDAEEGRPFCPCHSLRTVPAWWVCYPELGRSHEWEFWNDHAECVWCGVHSDLDPARCMAPCPARANALSLPEPVEVPQEPLERFGAAQGALRAAVERDLLIPVLDWTARRLQALTKWLKR